MKQNKIKAIRTKYLMHTTPELMSALKELRAATGMSINALLTQAVIGSLHENYPGLTEGHLLLKRHYERLAQERPEPITNIPRGAGTPVLDDLDSY